MDKKNQLLPFEVQAYDEERELALLTRDMRAANLWAAHRAIRDARLLRGMARRHMKLLSAQLDVDEKALEKLLKAKRPPAKKDEKGTLNGRIDALLKLSHVFTSADMLAERATEHLGRAGALMAAETQRQRVAQEKADEEALKDDDAVAPVSVVPREDVDPVSPRVAVLMKLVESRTGRAAAQVQTPVDGVSRRAPPPEL